MGGLEGIRHCDQATIRLACLRGKDGLELQRIVERRSNRLHAEGRSGGFERAEVIFEVWRCGRVEQEGDPVYARRNLLEQLQPLAAQRSFKIDETGDVAAWPRQARNEASADRIGTLRK